MCSRRLSWPQTEQIGHAPSAGARVMTLCTRVSNSITYRSTGTTRAKGKQGVILRADTVFFGLSVNGSLDNLHSARPKGRCPFFFYLPATKSTKNPFFEVV